MRIVEDRTASGAELLPAGQALIDPGALVLASLAGNLRHAAYFATVDAAKLAIRPAHFLNVVEALVIGGELAGDVYEFHRNHPIISFAR